MADDAPAAATTATATAAPAQPAGTTAATPAAPESPTIRTISVDPAHYERLQAQVRGSQEFYQAAKAAGITRPEDFSKFKAQPASTQEIPPQQTAGTTAFDPKELVQQVRDSVRLDRATEQHNEMIADEDSILAETVASLAGTQTGPTRDMVEAMALGLMDKIRKSNFYPRGHPLEGTRLAPVSRQQWQKDALPKLREILQGQKGATLAAIGDARNSGASTPAGVGGQVPGKVSANQSSHFVHQSRESKEALAAQYMAKFSASPTSALGQ